MRQRRPDGSIWVRTHPVTLLHDQVTARHAHEWDQLTYAASGLMRVHTNNASWVVPPHSAVWLPSGTIHVEEMHAPVSIRTLYLAPRIARALPRECRIVHISTLLRELILHVSRLGFLDRQDPRHARLLGVLLDELSSVADVPLQLPLPTDPRARRLCALLDHQPDDRAPIAKLARQAGASRRTIERLFLEETKMTVGEWRRRFRLLHAVRLLARGDQVTNAALDAGYASTSAFIAAFKRAFGTTPGRYPRSQPR
jgi:AraC-like DNA-binding protein